MRVPAPRFVSGVIVLGVVSLVVEMEVGDMIETAMVGRDGVVNGTSALDGKVALHRGIVQVAGEASVLASDALRSLAEGLVGGICGYCEPDDPLLLGPRARRRKLHTARDQSIALQTT